MLQFCIKNNYLSGDAASSVKNALIGKLPGGSAPSPTAAMAMAPKGYSTAPADKKMDLSGGGLKEPKSPGKYATWCSRRRNRCCKHSANPCAIARHPRNVHFKMPPCSMTYDRRGAR